MLAEQTPSPASRLLQVVGYGGIVFNAIRSPPDARFNTPLVSHHALIVAETNIQ
jgi:hypothetical protein